MVKIKTDYNEFKGDLNTPSSLADQFTNQSTTFLNQINAHPSDIALSTSGLNIFPLASKLGVTGVKMVTDHNFTLAQLRSDYSQHLLWSSVPYTITISPNSNGKLSIAINRPKQTFTLKWPDLNELRQCYYSLLSIAIVGHWKDQSEFTPGQVRFLMRLSGLKLVNANQLSGHLKNLIKDLDHHTISAQQACHFIPALFTTSNRGKLTILINLLKEEDLNDPQGYKPLLLAKSIYVNHVLGRLTYAKRQRLTNQPNFSQLDQIPGNNYLTMDNTYNWHPLTDQDVINFLKALIFYLE